jgi:sugar/nucleoside kinase (ribokinase family)
VSEAPIEVLHAGSASRDLTDDDPRGWRLGGGVTYAALTTARLGLRTAAIVGADREAASAAELDLLRAAGVELLVVPLAESPVFRNVETPSGRVQTCPIPGQPVPPVDLPRAWLAAGAWSLVPVAAEIGAAWARIVPNHAFLTVGWQGWLRELAAGRTVERRAPRSSALLRRADLIGVSHHDLAPGTLASDLRRLLRAEAALVLTDGEHGGQLLRRGPHGADEDWRYDAIEPDLELDPTGAGDTFLGALLASLVRRSTAPAALADLGPDLAFAAAAASLVIEQPGLLGVPDLDAVQARLARGHPDPGRSRTPAS